MYQDEAEIASAIRNPVDDFDATVFLASVGKGSQVSIACGCGRSHIAIDVPTLPVDVPMACRAP